MADIMSILQSELRCRSAKPYLAGLEIRQCRSDEMAGHPGPARIIAKPAGHDFDYQVSGYRANVTLQSRSGMQYKGHFTRTTHSGSVIPVSR